MKAYAKVFKVEILIVLAYAVIAAANMGAIASNIQAPNSLDLYNHLAHIIQAKMAWLEGQFPLRIAPLEQNGWFYPLFQFYSPSAYLFTGLLYQYITPANPYVAYKLAIGCASLGGAFYLYRLAYWLVQSRAAAFLSGIVYLTTPYFLINILHIGGFSEALALGILPSVVYYTLQRFNQPRSDKVLLQMGFVWSLLATVHIITFLSASFFLGLLLLLGTLKSKGHIYQLLSAGLGYVFGLMLSIWYLAPIGLFSHLLYIKRTAEVISNGKYIVSPLSLFSPAANIVNVIHENGMYDSIAGIHPAIGIPIVMAMGIYLYAVLCQQMRGTRRARYWLSPLVILFCMLFLIICFPASVWACLPKIFGYLQYSWRLLTQLVWIGSLIFAWAMCWVFKNKMDERHIVLCAMIILAFGSSWMSIWELPFAPIKPVLDNPYIDFAYQDAYLVDGYKNVKLVNNIDRLKLVDVLDAKSQKKEVNMLAPYALSQKAIKAAVNPMIMVEGIVDAQIKTHGSIQAVLNGQVISEWQIKPGAIHWVIPLIKYKNQSHFVFRQQFVNVADKEKAFFKVDHVLFEGMMDTSKVLGVDTVQKHCHRHGDVSDCSLFVPNGIQLLELPALFYPDMYQISLNGKNVNFESIFYEQRLIIAIKPIAGQVNKIKISFVALSWANYISSLTWGLWCIFSAYLFIQFCVSRGNSVGSKSYS